MLKNTALTKYEQFYEPNGLQAVITQFDVIPEYRKRYIGQSLLFLAGQQIDQSVNLYVDPTPYTPIVQLQEFKQKHNLSQYSVQKILSIFARMGFKPDQTPADEQLALLQVNRLKFNRNYPVDAKGVKLRYDGDMTRLKYRISQDIKSMV